MSVQDLVPVHRILKTPPRIHPTAIIEQDVALGHGTSVWDHVHIRHGSALGDECIVGGKSYIAYDVQIGNRVKINAAVYICNAVTIEDGVMVSAGVIFTNDRFPRATTSDLKHLRTSLPDEHTLPTLVRAGATIGAGAIIGCGLTIGRFAMVGMGAIVSRSVPDFHLVIGTPARSIGCVCRCGEPLARWDDEESAEPRDVTCSVCGLAYHVADRVVREFDENLNGTHGFSEAPVASALRIKSHGDNAAPCCEEP